MTNEDIIRMAEECDALITQNGQIIADCMDVEAFAALVAAAERDRLICAAETCIVCEQRRIRHEETTKNETNF